MLATFFLVVLAATPSIFFKQSAHCFHAALFIRNRREVRDEWKRNSKYAIAIGAVSPLAYILVLYAMQTAPISHVAPLREISMLFAAGFSARLLKEEQLKEKLPGAGLMVLGVVGLLW